MPQLTIPCKIEDYLFILDDAEGKGTAYVTVRIGDTEHSFRKNFEVRPNEKNCCI